MRVLCCLDGTNIEPITRALSTLVTADERTIGLLYVTDLGPHQEIERKREWLLRPRHLSGPLYEKMRQAEVASAQDILQEGLRYVPQAQTLSHEGNPEREIIQYASEWHADLVVICPRSPASGKPSLGPKSVGHVARFVLDHAPCPVLLIRLPMSEKALLSSDIPS
jgi:nucleotide-binding universal stress UspA family protein